MAQLDEKKFCPKCSIEKAKECFNPAPRRRGGLRAWCKACERDYVSSKLQKARDTIFEKLGRKCVRCGFSDPRALQIDHVHGNGYIEHKVTHKNTNKFLRKVLLDTENNYQLLCANCNWIKRGENQELNFNPPLSDEGRRRISEGRRAWVPTEEQRKKMRETHKGQQLSVESLARRAKAVSESWKQRRTLSA